MWRIYLTFLCVFFGNGFGFVASVESQPFLPLLGWSDKCEFPPKGLTAYRLATSEIRNIDPKNGTFSIGAVSFTSAPNDPTFQRLMQFFRNQQLGYGTTFVLHISVLTLGESVATDGLTLTGRITEQDLSYKVFEYIIEGKKNKIMFFTSDDCANEAIFRLQVRSEENKTDLKLSFSVLKGT